MIDVHLLIHGEERTDWLAQCIQSLAGEPISLHICDAIPGECPRARSTAIRKGTNDYIGWIDPDDFIIPGSYQRLINIIGKRSFAWAKEEVWAYDDNCETVKYKTENKLPHHIHIIHRDILDYSIIENPVHPNSPDAWTQRLMVDGIFDDNIGYVYRKYRNSYANKIINALKLRQGIKS